MFIFVFQIVNFLLWSFVLWDIQKIDEKTINEVFLKVLDNYIRWCRYLRIRLAWNRLLLQLMLWISYLFHILLDRISFHVSCSLEAINRDRKLFLVSLYFLIWGEAANVRFLPECICYIFHHVSLYCALQILGHVCLH